MKADNKARILTYEWKPGYIMDHDGLAGAMNAGQWDAVIRQY